MKSNFIRLFYADNTTLNPGSLGDVIATKDVGGVKHELVVNEFSDGAGGVTQVSAADPLPVTDNAVAVSTASIDLKTSNGSQKTQVVDGAGNVIGATANAMDVNIKSGNVTLIAQDIQIGAVELKNGTDDTRAVITPENALKVDGSAVTQPISAAALPLPSGAATAANQATEIAALASIDGHIDGLETSASSIDTKLSSQATAAKQDTGNTSLSTIAGKDFATQTTLAAVLAKITADPATQTTLAAILAKIIAAPSTEAKQDVIITSLASIDAGTAAALGQALMAASVPVVIASNQSAIPVSGTVTVDTSLLATSAKQDTQITAEQAILAKIIAAPATEAKQDTGNTSLASIKTNTDKIPALGQALAAASVPVVFTAAEEAVLAALLTQSDFDTKTGSLTETAPASDTASSGLNGRLQRVAQRLTSLITALGSPFQAGGSIANTTFAATQATAASLNMTEASAAAILAKLTAAAASMVKLEDVASADGDAGVPAMAVRKATPANTSGADGDYEMLQMSAGRLWVSAILEAGTALLGKVGIDQTTPGTTNKVSIGTDGTVAINTALPAGTNAIGKLAANDGVDIGDVTINNASGASAVNVQDGGNSLTVDAPVGTPVFVRLSDGSSAISTLAVAPSGIAGYFPVGGYVTHDAVGTGVKPNLEGGYASAAAPTDVSADGDAVNAWNLRNGARATVLTAAGALLGGDAANGLDVDVTRLPALVAGSALIGKVGIDQTTPGTTNAVVEASAAAILAKLTAAAASFVKLEDAASADGDAGVAVMAVRKATPANTSGTDGDYEPIQMSAGRVWASATIDAALPAGTNAIGKLAANSGVDIGDVDITSIIPGTGATNLGKAEDAAHASGDTGVFVLGVANEAQTTLAADGDYIAIATDIKGNNLVAGNIAHDGVDAGAPVKVGGKAVSADPTAVAASDRANFITDLVGKLVTLPYSVPEQFVSGATAAMTGTTSTSLLAAPAAGFRNYITTIIVSNSHATVGTDILIQDGSGGTTLLVIPAAAVYGGAAITLPTPLRQPTSATALFCANGTTGASTRVSAVGYIGR